MSKFKEGDEVTREMYADCWVGKALAFLNLIDYTFDGLVGKHRLLGFNAIRFLQDVPRDRPVFVTAEIEDIEPLLAGKQKVSFGFSIRLHGEDLVTGSATVEV